MTAGGLSAISAPETDLIVEHKRLQTRSRRTEPSWSHEGQEQTVFAALWLYNHRQSGMSTVCLVCNIGGFR